jgi:hypothetical protein
MKRDEQLRRRRPAQRVYLLAAFAMTILLGLSDDILAQSQWTTNGNDITNANPGNVGIGTNPDLTGQWNGFAKILSLQGTSQRSILELSNSSTGTSGVAGQISFENGSTYLGAILGISEGATNSGYLSFWTNNAGAFSEKMRVNKAGNVGIGTNSPLGILHARSPASTHASLFLDTTSAGYASYFAFYEAGQGRASIMHNPSQIAGGLLFQTGGLSSPANTRMAIDSVGNVGIGTITPSYKLDVQGGAINASGGLCIAGDCKTSWAQVGGGGGGSQWSTSGSADLYYNSGNVGIGTPSPATKLHLSGSNATMQIAGDAGSAGESALKLGFANYGPDTLGGRISHRGDSGGLTLDAFGSTLSSGDIVFRTASGNRAAVSPRMTIKYDGNVGIGTTSPGHLLSLQKAASFTGTTALSPTNGLLDLYNSQSAAIGEGAMMVFSADYLEGGVTSTKTSRAAIKGGSQFVDDNRGGFLAFYVNGTAVTNSLYERMRINSAGNVGIGTTSPETLLHLEKSDASGAGVGILLNNTLGHKFGLYSGGSSHGAIPNTLAVYDYTASAYRLAIDANGNVGIGTTSPTTRLDVAGLIRSSTGGFKFPDGTVQTTAAVSGGITSVTAGTGLTGGGTSGPVTLTNADPGSSQPIFKNIANAAGAPQFSAGSNNDALRFEGTGGTSVTFEAVTKKIIINSSTSGGSQWTTNASNIYYNTGNVGIGTPSPQVKLAIGGAGVNVYSTDVWVENNLYVQGPEALAQGGGRGRLRVGSAWGYSALYADASSTGGGNDLVLGASSGTVRVGPGGATSQSLIVANGDINASGTITGGNIIAKYQDVAEWVPVTHALPAGTVVVLNPTKSNQVMASASAYDTRVAGVISERPGLALGEAGIDKVLVATTGRVKVKVDASHAPIHVGDLLVTSDKEGVAMKSEPLSLGGTPIHRPGTLIGKALEPLEKGTGEILVLLSLQ